MGRLATLLLLLAVGPAAGCFIKPEPPSARLDGSTDPRDAMPLCASFGSWGPPTPLTELNASGVADYAPTVTADAKRIIFHSSRGSTTDPDSVESVWNDATNTWSTPQFVHLMDFGGGPFISPDGLTVWFQQYNGSADIVMATRATLETAFTSVVPFPPFTTSEYERDLEISSDGLEAVLFVGSGGATEDIAIATRPDTSAPFSPWQRIPAIMDSSYACCPTLSPDRLTILWEAGAIFMTTRATRSAPFGAASVFTALNPAATDYGDPHFSRDGTKLFYTARPKGGLPSEYDLYMLERPCLVP